MALAIGSLGIKTTTHSESTVQFISAYPMDWVDVLEGDPARCHQSRGIRWVAFLVDPCAVYRLEEFYRSFDCVVLFGADVSPMMR